MVGAGSDEDAGALEVFDVAAERSFFAHPVPLKWTAGGANTLRILPPHSGHPLGPWSWTLCTTSSR